MQDTTRRHAVTQLSDSEYELVRGQAVANCLPIAGYVRRAAVKAANAERRSEVA